SGGAAERRSGGAAERRSGGAAERRSGGAAERRSGGASMTQERDLRFFDVGGPGREEAEWASAPLGRADACAWARPLTRAGRFSACDGLVRIQ
ncbi:hypothetical protein, partial [Actinoallomurus bryophytorum]